MNRTMTKKMGPKEAVYQTSINESLTDNEPQAEKKKPAGGNSLLSPPAGTNVSLGQNTKTPPTVMKSHVQNINKPATKIQQDQMLLPALPSVA